MTMFCQVKHFDNWKVFSSSDGGKPKAPLDALQQLSQPEIEPNIPKLLPVI